MWRRQQQSRQLREALSAYSSRALEDRFQPQKSAPHRGFAHSLTRFGIRWAAGFEVGITVDVVRIPEGTPVEAVLERIALFNADPSISGVLVLHPMSGFTPEEERRVFDAVDRHKDIDGTNSAMIGLLALKQPGYIPCTAEGIVELLKRSGRRSTSDRGQKRLSVSEQRDARRATEFSRIMSK
jgi:Tetrahydrofolate dehydrogenase/cyclohydrolase, catalytic domain